MNKKNILACLLLTLPVMMFTSCLKDQEDFFDEPATKRLTAFLDNTKKTLTSAENGWVLNYYPDRDLSYGGFAYTIKFNDETVEARYELDDPANSITSTYTLCNEDGPSILFDTYNEFLHYFTTPSGSSGAGGYEAYDGDHMFLILDVAEDGKTITLKGSRSGNIMYMYKLEESAESYLNKVLETEEKFGFSKYLLCVGQDTAVVKVSGGNIFTFITDEEEIYAPGIFTPAGLKFYEPVEVFGKTIEGVQAVEVQDDSYAITALNDRSLVFQSVVPPLNEQLIDGEWYISYSGFSAFGQNYYNSVIAGQASIGETMEWAYVGANENGNFAYCFSSDGYYGSLIFKYSLIDEDKIAMQFAMQGTQNGVWYHNNANYTYALFPFGYNSLRTFTISADNKVSPSEITLTEDANPKNVIVLSASPIYDPLNN